MPLDESPTFEVEPRTQADFTRANWRKLGDLERLIREEVITRLDTTNGRVTALEHWRWAIAGGISVVVALVLPVALYFLTHLATQ